MLTRYQKLYMYITHDCLISRAKNERYRCCGIYPCKSAWSDLIQTNYCVGEPIYSSETTKREREVEAQRIRRGWPTRGSLNSSKRSSATIIY